MNNSLKTLLKTPYFAEICAKKEENIDSLIHFKDLLYNFDKSIKTQKDLSLYNNEELINEVGFYAFALLDLDYDNAQDRDFLFNYLFKSLHVLDENEYLNNPYQKNIKFIDKKLGHWEFKKSKYSPLELFVFDNSKYINNKEIPNIGFFKNDFYYDAVYKDNLLWMSITPNEINTMKEPINNAFGKCLVLGLGLGYFQYMISNKDNVTSIDIVELDKDVISLFKNNILTQFDKSNKIRIINDDAYKFLQENDLSNYDYIFIDLYHDTWDGLMWLIKLIKLEKENIKYDYWIKKPILNLFKNMVITTLENINDLSNMDEIYQNIYSGIEKSDVASEEIFMESGLIKILKEM